MFIRLKTICCRRSRRLVGFAGLCSRGLMIAPASSAAWSGDRLAHGWPK
jgi:hypothetical protein